MTDTGDKGRNSTFRRMSQPPQGPLAPDVALEAIPSLRDQAVKYLELQRAIIAAGHHLDDVMRLTVGKVREMMPKAGGAVVDLLDDDILECSACSGDTVPPLGFRMPVAGSFSGLCLEVQQALLCVDTLMEARINREACDLIGARSLVAAPLFVHGMPRGVLKILSCEPNAFGTDELLMTELLAAPIIIGISAQSARETAREKLQLERRFRATFEHAAVGIAHVDREGRFLMVNEKFCQIVGREPGYLLGGSFKSITHPDDLEEDVGLFKELVAGTVDNFSVEKRYVRPNNIPAWTRVTASAVRNADGELDFCVSIIEDIVREKQAQQEVLAHPLTALPNRRWLQQNLPHMLAGNRDRACGLGIAFIDLDGFKSVNDRFGHLIGDRCLIAVADVLQAQVKGRGSVVHLSGDEFIVILEDVNEKALEDIGLRICEAIRDLAAQNDWTIDASIGAVLVGGGDKTAATDLLRLADELMYRAKRAGGGRQMIAAIGSVAVKGVRSRASVS
ncbi:MAG: diguanylate cyclase [Novosphingobium sp.]|nr:diguanylate cyclase [Novosphingobium sp.]